MPLLHLSLSSLFVVGSLASTFSPNCTLPSSITTYVSGPNTRGTLTILWDCLSIIILCVWNIQHLNVPAMQPPTTNIWQEIWRAVLDSRTKIKWACLTILVPEYIVGKALGDCLGARKSRTRMLKARIENSQEMVSDYLNRTETEWETIHAYMANMGYFVINVKPDGGQYTDPRFEERLNAWENDPELRLSKSEHTNYSRLRYQYWALNAWQLERAVKWNVVDLPKVSSRDLQALDKGGTLAKALAVLQVSYLIIQLIARKVANLPSAQLEIATLAFAAQSLVTYFLYLDRPQGVENIHIIPRKNPIDDDTWRELLRVGPVYLWQSHRNPGKSDYKQGPVPIPNDALIGGWSEYRQLDVFGGNDEMTVLAFGALVGGTLFGGLHCLAWDFHFPTSAEKLAWRICSVLISGLPPLSAVPIGIWMRWNPATEQRKRNQREPRKLIPRTLVTAFLVPYMLARLFILVEIIRTLFFLPPEAFVDTWSGSFPHWG